MKILRSLVLASAATALLSACGSQVTCEDLRDCPMGSAGASNDGSADRTGDGPGTGTGCATTGGLDSGGKDGSADTSGTGGAGGAAGVGGAAGATTGGLDAGGKDASGDRGGAGGAGGASGAAGVAGAAGATTGGLDSGLDVSTDGRGGAAGSGGFDGGPDAGADSARDSGVDVGNGSDTPDTAPPTVVMVAPPSNATNAEPGALVQATFSEALLGSTVNAGSFTLMHDGQAVTGTVSLSGAVATFTPTGRFALLGDYTATLSTAITDLAGNALASNYTWSFHVRDGAWSPSAVLDPDGTTSKDPQVATDNHSSAIAVWQAETATANYIYANRYVWGGAWGSKAELGTAAKVKAPQIALDQQGNGIAVWLQQHSVSMQWHVWGARYVSKAWVAPAAIAATADSDEARVAVDSAGNVTAVWTESDGTRRNLVSKYLPVGGSWSATETLEMENGGDAANPQLAVNHGGAAIVIWTQSDGVRGRTWGNKRAARASWEGGGAVQVTTDRAAQNSAVALDDAGNATVLWQESNQFGRDTLIVRRFLNASGWGPPQQLDDGNAWNPRLNADSNGNVMGLWTQTAGTERLSTLARRFVSGADWGAVKLLELDTSADAFFPQVGTDKKGNAIAVWTLAGGVSGNRYIFATDWAQATQIGGINTSSEHVALAVDPEGSALARPSQSWRC